MWKYACKRTLERLAAELGSPAPSLSVPHDQTIAQEKENKRSRGKAGKKKRRLLVTYNYALSRVRTGLILLAFVRAVLRDDTQALGRAVGRLRSDQRHWVRMKGRMYWESRGRIQEAWQLTDWANAALDEAIGELRVYLIKYLKKDPGATHRPKDVQPPLLRMRARDRFIDLSCKDLGIPKNRPAGTKVETLEEYIQRHWGPQPVKVQQKEAINPEKDYTGPWSDQYSLPAYGEEEAEESEASGLEGEAREPDLAGIPGVEIPPFSHERRVAKRPTEDERKVASTTDGGVLAASNATGCKIHEPPVADVRRLGNWLKTGKCALEGLIQKIEFGEGRDHGLGPDLYRKVEEYIKTKGLKRDLRLVRLLDVYRAVVRGLGRSCLPGRVRDCVCEELEKDKGAGIKASSTFTTRRSELLRIIREVIGEDARLSRGRRARS
jgi:hypothetical protein